MANNIVEFPKAKNDAMPPLSRMRCGACGSTEWHLVLPHPELRRGKMACTGCGEQFGLWMELIAEFPIE